MFAGPDQLLLGVLAGGGGSSSRGGGGGGGGRSSAAQALEAALGGGDADSVREWLNEQAGIVAPLVYGGGGSGSTVSSSMVSPADVEFTEAARGVVGDAREGATAMGCRCVGTYHLLLVLMGAGVGDGGRDSAEGAEGAAAAAGGGKARGKGAGMLPALLRVAGADAGALESRLMALAKEDGEPPAEAEAGAAFRSVVESLRGTYKQQSTLPWQERDEAAFRALGGSRGGAGGGGRAAQNDDDIYE
ncbi:hypothetical protein HYH03_005106 [Edaphochlamys debaryana]|uniref:Uncharacterized protein n=1 Tax=Edaphochlamys debaryana TaxID=47281 RepID=A0A835Y8F6_9CHLO|nr:hypothetical protein HYH03_005106 [Edaphochlamys debaryana]|eukprot:KAG2496688.1 hypothetical protein HYH03_005106 [Edaphochlamys debaryana]